MNLDLKIALLKTFRTQIVASRRLKITEGRLSHFVRGHDQPNKHERRLLEKALGRDYFTTQEDGPQAA